MNETKKLKIWAGGRDAFRQMRRVLALIVFLFALQVSATQYYVDFASGSDANNGLSKSSPWQHMPGMPGFGAAYNYASGDIFTTKLGVTWPRSGSCFTWRMTYKINGNEY